MPRWLEFHDSEFVSLVHDAMTAVLELDGYVHHWEHLDSGWNGAGWTQRIRITVLNPSVRTGEPKAVGEDGDSSDIWEGSLVCGAQTYDNQLIPLPFSCDAESRLTLEMISGRKIDILGFGVRIMALGDPTFVETLRDDLAPDDSGEPGRWH